MTDFSNSGCPLLLLPQLLHQKAHSTEPAFSSWSSGHSLSMCKHTALRLCLGEWLLNVPSALCTYIPAVSNAEAGAGLQEREKSCILVSVEFF